MICRGARGSIDRRDMTSSLTVDIEAAPELSLAMVENAVPLVARLALTNTGSEDLAALAIEVALPAACQAPWTAHVSALPAGGTFHLDEVALPLDRATLVNQLERAPAELTVTVRAGDAVIATASRRLDVLAYNE